MTLRVGQLAFDCLKEHIIVNGLKWFKTQQRNVAVLYFVLIEQFPIPPSIKSKLIFLVCVVDITIT